MGKNQHSKDRLFITATEWKQQYGGHRQQQRHGYRRLPFNCCALSLTPFETPMCTKEGVIFDMLNIVPYVRKHKKNPVTGEPMAVQDLIRLNMAKNAEGEWHCPVTFKVFNDNTHIVAIKTTGNVFAYEAVQELNIKSKNFVDLLTGEPFTRRDIITLQDPSNAEFMALRDINNFKHMQELREEQEKADSESKTSASSNIRASSTVKAVLDEIHRRQAEGTDLASASSAALMTSPAPGISSRRDVGNWKEQDDLKALADLDLTVQDLFPGRELTSHRASGSFTSTVMSVTTQNEARAPTAEEVREAKYRKMRDLGKKGYLQMVTTMGNLNLEIYCDMAPQTAENFLKLCQKGYYDGTKLHRLVKDFMVQGGDPSGTGAGGESIWGRPFKDEFDSRLTHDRRGLLSMANSGPNTNGSQFFVLFRSASHLNNKHTIFGRVAGGMDTLDRIEAVGNDKKERPLADITIIRTDVFVDPIPEAEAELREELAARIASRKAAEQQRQHGGKATAAAATAAAPSLAAQVETRPELAVAEPKKRVREPEAPSVGKYLRGVDISASTAPQNSAAEEESAPIIPKKKAVRGTFGDFDAW